MQNPAERPMRAASFLDWSMTRPENERWELSGGVPVPMASERVRHNLSKTEVIVVLRRSLDSLDSPCRVFSDGISIVIDDDNVYEPDAVIRC